MKKMLSLVMAVVMILSLFSGMGVVSVAEDDVLNYLTYEINDGEVTITGVDESITGSITLPGIIEGYPVTEIGRHAFLKSHLSYVEFPDTLRRIGYGAFWNSRLEIVKIPDSVEIIGDDAFGDCFSLKGIYTGKNITEISGQMLRENSALTDVFIGKKVKKIGYWGFNLSDNIENIYYEGTQEEWNQIVVNPTGNDVLKTANIIFNCTDDSYSVFQPTKFDPETMLLYSISAGKVTIEGVDWDIAGDLVIPEYIDGCAVTCIADNAFNFLPDLKSVTIPKSVTEIKDVFGCQCFNLENIYVDKDNQYYSSEDGNLFNKDKTELIRYAIGNGRQEYTIPDTVKTIRADAFVRLYSDLKLNIPESVTEIQDYAFWSAHNLCYIDVDENNPAFVSDNGVLFNKDKTKLLCFPGSRARSYDWAGYEYDEKDMIGDCYTIPESVTEIAKGAFGHCLNLESIVIPENVVNIDENAFRECESLKNINLPERLTVIHDFAFSETGIESIVIPDSVTSIGIQVFYGCDNLSEIHLNDNLKSIGWGTFYETDYYKNADNWENNALYIGNCLIEVDDDTITEYTVKNGTRCIGGCAFSDSSMLEKVNLPDSLYAISNEAIRYSYRIKEIILPEGVTEIGDYAFGDCSSLRKVSIPESVAKIGDGIFYWSDSIRQIDYAGDKAGWNNIEISEEGNDWVSYLTINCKKEPVVDEPSTQEPTTQEPTTQEPTTQEPSTQEPSTQEPSTQEPTTQEPATQHPTTQNPDDKPDVMSGDLDGNGKITAADARIALRISAKIEYATEEQKMLADVNLDGKITAADARKILRIAAKLESL